MKSTPARRLYTVREAALILGMSKSAMYEHIAQNHIEVTRFGGSFRLTAATLEVLLGERPPTPHEVNEMLTSESAERGHGGRRRAG